MSCCTPRNCLLVPFLHWHTLSFLHWQHLIASGCRRTQWVETWSMNKFKNIDNIDLYRTVLMCAIFGAVYDLWTSSSIPIFGCCVPSLVVGRIANVCRRMQRDWNPIGTWFVNQFKNTSFGGCVPSFGPRRLYSCFLLVFWIRWHKPCFFPLPSIGDPLYIYIHTYK